MKMINYFKNLSESRKNLLIILLFFFIAFIIRSIKANFFQPWLDELDAAVNVKTFEEALRWYKWHPMAPFHVTFNIIFKHFSSNSIYWQRFPTIVAGALMVPLFYCVLKHFLSKSRWPIILTIIPLTSFILVYFSQELRSYAYLWLLILASLYFGYKVIVEGSRNKFDLLALFFSFALLPIVQYISMQHFLVLDVALLACVLLFSQHKWLNILKIVSLNLIIPIAYLNWSDSAFYRVIKRAFIIGPAGEINPAKPFYFDNKMFWAVINKVAGGHYWWSITIVAVCLVSIVILVISLIRARKKRPITPWESFVLFNVIYALSLFLLLKITRYPEVIMVRHHIFIIWPLLIILSYLLIKLWQRQNWQGVIAKIFVILFLSFLIGNNIVNTTAYLLASHRFFPGYKAIAEKIEPIIINEHKTIVYSEMGGGELLKPYFKNPDTVKPEMFIYGPVFWDTTPEKLNSSIQKRNLEIQKLIDCCGRQTIFIFATFSNSRDRDAPKVDFKNLTFIKNEGQNKYLEYLNNIDASPYGKGSTFNDGYAAYMLAY